VAVWEFGAYRSQELYSKNAPRGHEKNTLTVVSIWAATALVKQILYNWVTSPKADR